MTKWLVDQRRLPRKRRWQQLRERLDWFHYETRERRYMLRVFGVTRLP